MEYDGKTYSKIFCLIAFFLIYTSLNFFSFVEASSTGSITATVAVGVCGNNVVEYGEDCDTSALDGQTCQSLGYDGGTLNCDTGCEFNLSECVNLAPEEGSVVFSGKAYPSAVIKILKDGQIAATTSTDSKGDFETTLSNLIVGTYSFGVYAYDVNNIKSKTITFRKEVSKDEVGTISNIILPPTLSIKKDPVQEGETYFFGHAAPSSKITIELSSNGGNWTLDAKAGRSGYYSYRLETKDYDSNDYQVSAKAKFGNLESEGSESVYFQIANETIQFSEYEVDLNEDSRVNLIDSSILMYQSESQDFSDEVDSDVNKEADLSDFSVMMYYWTG